MSSMLHVVFCSLYLSILRVLHDREQQDRGMLQHASVMLLSTRCSLLAGNLDC